MYLVCLIVIKIVLIETCSCSCAEYAHVWFINLQSLAVPPPHPPLNDCLVTKKMLWWHWTVKPRWKDRFVYLFKLFMVYRHRWLIAAHCGTGSAFWPFCKKRFSYGGKHIQSWAHKWEKKSLSYIFMLFPSGLIGTSHMTCVHFELRNCYNIEDNSKHGILNTLQLEFSCSWT
jgi:hypothetical protein